MHMDWTKVSGQACWRAVLLGCGAFWLGVSAMIVIFFRGKG
jgi:hypothetical protein